MANETNSTPVDAASFSSTPAAKNQKNDREEGRYRNWRVRAACRFEDPELFHLTGKENTKPVREQIFEAKKVCAECPVQKECLDWAIRTRDSYSIAGGLTPSERQSLLDRSTPRKKRYNRNSK